MNQNNLTKLRHTTEHVLQQAVKNLYGDQITMAMGPATDHGFYFDFETKNLKISELDFPKIEKEMQKIIDQNLPLIQKKLPISKAKKLFKNNPYKQEWIDEIKTKKEKPSVYWTGDQFVDLCSGPHLESTNQIKAFKLLSIAGAYWHGDEKNKMLTRIYGTAFPTKKELDQYLQNLKEAKKRDHKKLGQKLKLFFLSNVAPGMPFWQPKGMIIRNLLFERFKKIQEEFGYQEVMGPNLLSVEVFKQSGHWDHYRDDMFFTQGKGNRQYAIRPMDCPGEIIIYQHHPRSYKELPIKYSEIGTVTRNEKSGELNGLFRVAQMTQDDAHVFMREDQIKDQIKEILIIAQKLYQPFNLNYKIYVSTRPDNFMGDPKIWDQAEKILKEIIKESSLPLLIKEKDGAFYGPKIDFEVKDSLNRTWQCATIQLDFFMPKKFNLEYIGKDGKKHRPIMCHRALMGSIERFIGILIEHYAGAFPLWLSPIQIALLPISQKHNKFTQKLASQLKEQQIRTEINSSNQSLNKKILHSESQKIPYMAIIGDKEIKSNSVSLRARNQKNLGSIAIEELIKKIQKESIT
jgi:threonyl-tRNA synthetase